MEENKYSDLSQQLAESEKQLYEKISEECASSFELAIDGSIKKLKSNVESMNDVVNKVQSCKDSYEEAAQVVGKLSNALSEADDKVLGISKELEKLSEETNKTTSDISEKASEMIKLSNDFEKKTKENTDSIKSNCESIKRIGEEYSGSIGDVIEGLKGLKTEIQSTEEKITEQTKKLLDDSAAFSSKTEKGISKIDDFSSDLVSLKADLKDFNSKLNENKEKVIKVNSDIKNAEERITSISNNFKQLEVNVAKYDKQVTKEIKTVTEQAGKFSDLLSKNTTEISNLVSEQQKWKGSCEAVLSEMQEKVELLIKNLNENNETIKAETEKMKAYQEGTQSCIDDVKKSTEEYVKLVQEAKESLKVSIDTYKNDLLSANDEQNRLISSIKEEQIKQKKMYLFGIIPAVIIIALQIISILL